MLAMLVLSRSDSVPAVARNVGGLAVLPLVVAPRPGVNAVACNTHQYTGQTNERYETEDDFGGSGRGRARIRKKTQWRRTEREGNGPVEEVLGEAAVAVEDVALDEVVGGPLPEGRDRCLTEHAGRMVEHTRRKWVGMRGMLQGQDRRLVVSSSS